MENFSKVYLYEDSYYFRKILDITKAHYDFLKIYGWNVFIFR